MDCFGIFAGGQVHVLIFSSHTVSLEVDAVGVVYDPVENGVGDCGLADHVVPARDGQLRGDDCGSPLITFLEEFEQVEALLVREPVGAPIVENEKYPS